MIEPSDPLALEDVQMIVGMIKLNLRYGQRKTAIELGLGLLSDAYLETATRIIIQTVIGIEYGVLGQHEQALLLLTEAFELALLSPYIDVDMLIASGHGLTRAQIALGDVTAAKQTMQLLDTTLMPPGDLKASLVSAEQLLSHRELTDEIESLINECPSKD
ncbi:MAG TPA: hypothetical protein VM581_05125 [Magnetospirillaceae bacterium]|nr:hypothetical protein [Magnetospirillaceae bacterium]